MECDKVGLGKAKVDRVASIRRLKSKDGKAITRWSSCTDPKLIAMPEGPIDPFIKTITFAKGDKPIVRLHYYATHPQSFYGDPRASYDVPGIAREAVEEEDGAMQIYFNGCAGNVTMGKYNNRTKEARTALSKRLAQGMRDSIAATKWQPVEAIEWKVVPWKMVPRTDGSFAEDKAKATMNNPSASTAARWGAALDLDFLARIDRPIDLSVLKMGDMAILNLPGESFIEYQHYAQELLPGDFVAVARLRRLCPGVHLHRGRVQRGWLRADRVPGGSGIGKGLQSGDSQGAGGEKVGRIDDSAFLVGRNAHSVPRLHNAIPSHELRIPNPASSQ